MAARKKDALTYDEALAEALADSEFREAWEATALAREVAVFLVRYRTDHRLSQTALARRLGVSQSQVARLEEGEHEPRVATLRRLSEVLGMTVNLTIEPPAGPSAAARVSVAVS